MSWAIEASKSGYTPIMFSNIILGNSTTIAINPENVTLADGYFKLSGYGRSMNSNSYTASISVVVLWKKND